MDIENAKILIEKWEKDPSSIDPEVAIDLCQSLREEKVLLLRAVALCGPHVVSVLTGKSVDQVLAEKKKAQYPDPNHGRKHHKR